MNNSDTPGTKVSSPQQQARIIAEYSTAYNAVTQPLSYVAMSHYYASRWAAEVGGTGTLIILQLRALGFYNPTTGEIRDNIIIALPELAKRCGVSVATVKRELRDNAALQQFVSREPQWKRDRLGEVYRSENVYHVRMDDPLHPNDQAKLAEEIERREKGYQSSADGMAQIERGSKASHKGKSKEYVPPMAQNDQGAVQIDMSPVQSVIPPVQIDSHTAQIEPALKNHSLSSPITQNNFEKKEAASPRTLFSFLSREEQERYDQAAEAEMEKAFGLEWAKVTHKDRMRRQRAETLYAVDWKAEQNAAT